MIVPHEFTYIYSWNYDIRLSLAQNKVHETQCRLVQIPEKFFWMEVGKFKVAIFIYVLLVSYLASSDNCNSTLVYKNKDGYSSTSVSFLFLTAGLTATLSGAMWRWCSTIICFSLISLSGTPQYVLLSLLKWV